MHNLGFMNDNKGPLSSFMNADRFYFRYYLIKMRGRVGGDVCGETYLCVEG